MKFSVLISMSMVSVLTALVLPVRLAAQEQSATQHETRRPPRYAVTDLGALPSGTFSQATFVSDSGLTSGLATLPDGTQHAVLWFQGRILDIGRSGLAGHHGAGLNSAALGVNERGQAAELAELSTPDPNGEDFCGYGTQRTCRPFVWQDGVTSPLPTLGGNNGETGQINNRGEVAGNAENATLDMTCLGLDTPQRFQEKPVIWKNGQVHELPTYPGDPDGWAFGINDHGQVVGASGSCSSLNPATVVYVLSSHALLWDNGTLTDLRSLGGTGAFGPGNIALVLNNNGQVVGTSDLEGDTAFHAFLWTRETGMRDLGTLPGDENSSGIGINDRGEVVGVSIDAEGNIRAFLWQNGRMRDLNEQIPADSPLFLLFAHSINSRGQIAGFGVQKSTGEVHAFLATPTSDPR